MNGRTRPNLLLLLISVQTIPYSRWTETVTKLISCSVVCLLVCMPVGHECQPCKVQRNVRTAVDAVRRYMDSGPVAPPGGRGEASPLWVDVQKLCNMCVLSLSWDFFVSHTTNILQGRRAKSHVDTQTIQPGLGDFVL